LRMEHVNVNLGRHKVSTVTRSIVLLVSSSFWRSHMNLFDISLMRGRFRNDNVTGFDFAWQIGPVGIRGELTHNYSDIFDPKRFLPHSRLQAANT